jgi:hypothetical protein
MILEILGVGILGGVWAWLLYQFVTAPPERMKTKEVKPD